MKRFIEAINAKIPIYIKVTCESILELPLGSTAKEEDLPKIVTYMDIEGNISKRVPLGEGGTGNQKK